ncbi:hypothetical protein SAMN04488550_0014 [Gordonia malaquae]|nr:hypothetical protein SAMN04488550_0014 [Gordonia malaquae]
MTSDRRSLTKRWLIIAGAIVFVLAVAIASLAIFRNFQDSEPKSNVHGFSEPGRRKGVSAPPGSISWKDLPTCAVALF